MSDQIAKFEPANYVEKLRDKMKSAICDIIPDEQWDAMLKAEIDGFFKERVQKDHWGNQDKVIPSSFHQAIEQVLSDECKNRVSEMLKSPEWTGYWDGQKQIAGAKIEEMVREQGVEILNRWLGAAIQQVVAQIGAIR